jgi:acetyl-CoA C-acetyltransferase
VNVHLSGVAVLPFTAYPDTSLARLGHDAAEAALEDAGVPYGDVGEVFASSMLSPPQTALAIARSLGETGVPVTAVESASAGGLVALRHAAWAVESGRCSAALAIGYEKTTTLERGGVVPQPRSLWDRLPPQVHYAIEATRWLHDRGCGPEVFAAVAAKSWNQAALNPLAARRPDHVVTTEEVLTSRMVATPLTRMMCHASADGAAAAVITRNEIEGSVELSAIEQTSRLGTPTWPADGPVVGPPSQTVLTARRAYADAGIRPGDVDVVSVHDMCASEELLTLVALGLCTADEAVKLATKGQLAHTGTLPTNTDGGCVARGHPMGATGLAQVAEVVHQLRGQAGDRQVTNAGCGLVQAAGGGGSCVVAILKR